MSSTFRQRHCRIGGYLTDGLKIRSWPVLWLASVSCTPSKSLPTTMQASHPFSSNKSTYTHLRTNVDTCLNSVSTVIHYKLSLKKSNLRSMANRFSETRILHKCTSEQCSTVRDASLLMSTSACIGNRNDSTMVMIEQAQVRMYELQMVCRGGASSRKTMCFSGMLILSCCMCQESKPDELKVGRRRERLDASSRGKNVFPFLTNVVTCIPIFSLHQRSENIDHLQIKRLRRNYGAGPRSLHRRAENHCFPKRWNPGAHVMLSRKGPQLL